MKQTISMTDFEKKVKECSFNDKIFVELINSSSKKKKRKMVLCLLMNSYTWATLRLKGVNLKGVNLSGLKFTDVEITDSNLRDANFANCHFENVTIKQTDLRKTVFRFSKLRDVSFHNCQGTRHIMDSGLVIREDVTDSEDDLPEDIETVTKLAETIRHQDKTREDEEVLSLVLSRNLAMHGFTEEQILGIHCEINNVCRDCLDGPPDCYCQKGI